MEPILLSFDKIRYDSDITRLQIATKSLTPKFKQIIELSGIEMTEDLVRELLYANEPVLTLQSVKDKIVTSLENAGIRIKAIKDASTTQAVEDFYRIFNELSRIRTGYAGLWLARALYWDGEQLQISESFAVEHKEQFSSYVRTEAGEALRQAHLKYLNAAKELYAALPQRNRGLIFNALERALNSDNSLRGICLPAWGYDRVAAEVDPWDPDNKVK